MCNNSIQSLLNSRAITSMHAHSVYQALFSLDMRLLASLNWQVFPSWPFLQQRHIYQHLGIACWWWPSGSIQWPSNFMLGYRKWYFYLLILTPYYFALCSTMSRFSCVLQVLCLSLADHQCIVMHYTLGTHWSMVFHGLLEYCTCWGHPNGSLDILLGHTEC